MLDNLKYYLSEALECVKALGAMLGLMVASAVGLMVAMYVITLIFK